MSTMLRCLMVGCLTVVCGCALQQGGRGEKSGVAAQETRYAGFASQLGEQMEGTIASVEKTPFGGPAEVSVGRPYVSGLRMLCRRATLTDPHREMTVAMSSGWIVQGRVIMALILREVHTLYGSSRLGYLWAVIQTMFGIGIFWGIREIAGARAPHGMSVLMFLLAGFGLWATFSETLTKCMSAVSGNKALLTFPQVTPLDLMLSQLSSGCVITGIAAFCGTSLYVSDWTGLFAAFLLTPLLGLGCGMLCASLAVFWPTLEKIVPMILRILFFASGIFFSVSMFPKNIADILLLNPVMQLIELLRQSLSRGYVAPTYDYLYIVAFCVVSLCLGGLLERYARKRAEQ